MATIRFCELLRLGAVGVLAGFLFCRPAAGTALDDYVAAPDANYSYSQEGGGAFDFSTFTTAYTLRMTSQLWRDASEVAPVVWTHWVTIYKPSNFLIGTDTAMLLINDGNSADIDDPPDYNDQYRQLAAGTGSVIAIVSAVPNQPLWFADENEPRIEDEIIAYSWDKFLQGGDAYWPVQLPMVKSVVRAMDAVQDFCAVNSTTINSFVLTGGSKRGWTAWLTAAVDSRVVAIAPIVSDLLNMKRSFDHHWAAYGFWADALWPYEELGIFDWFDTERVTALLAIVDPYEYRDRLTMPKFIVNAAGDQFFVPDSAQFYIDSLLGEVYLREVPNTDHYLTDAFDDVLNSMVPYYDAFLNGQARPQFNWTFEADGAIRVETQDVPKAVHLWQASNPNERDFRMLTIGTNWLSTPLADAGGGVYIGQLDEPNQGWTAFFVELVYESSFQGPDEFDFHFTTEMRVLPEILPFEADLNRDRITDVLDMGIFGGVWLSGNVYRDIWPRRGGDGVVDFKDFAVLAVHWLEGP